MLNYITYLGYVITWERIKPDPNKLQVIKDLGRHTTTTEERALIGIVQYYIYMWSGWYKTLSPLTEASIRPKV